MKKLWYMELPFHKLQDHLSRADYLKLRRFYTQQLALSQALLEAKLPGICKTTTSVENLSLDMFLDQASRERCTSSSVDSREMFSSKMELGRRT